MHFGSRWMRQCPKWKDVLIATERVNASLINVQQGHQDEWGCVCISMPFDGLNELGRLKGLSVPFLGWVSFSFDRVREETQKSWAVFFSPHFPRLPINDKMYICASMRERKKKKKKAWKLGKIVPISKNKQSSSASQHTFRLSAELKTNEYPAMFPPCSLNRTQGPYTQDNL